MNIKKELQKAWDNAITTEEEKQAASEQSLEELKKEIEKGGGAYPERVELPDAPTYEKMEREKVSDEELQRRAEQSLKGYESQALKTIEEKTEAKRAELEGKKESAEKEHREKLEQIDEVYGEAKRSLDEDVLKRGLARSSIAVARSADLESGRADAATSARGEYEAAIGQLTELLGSLNESKASAIGDLKAELAGKIADKVESLREKARQADIEALKYNNSLAEKEAKQQTDRLKDAESLYSDALSNALKEQQLGSGATARENRLASNYNKMDGLLSKMNRSDAAKLIKDDPFFRANLSEYLYYKLYDKYCN